MRSRRNDWLTSLTMAEFAALDPWVFINHEDSRCQWVAEVRKRLRSAMTNDEILSILSLGLYECVRRAIINHQDAEPQARGAILIGTALRHIRLKGIAKVFDEIPGASTVSLADIESASVSRRSHALQDDYYAASASFAESLEATPVFLSEGVLLADATRQTQHRLIEQIRSKLTSREHQLLRLLVMDDQSQETICEILDLSQKQVGKIRRGLKSKLASIAVNTGADVSSIPGIAGGLG